MLIPSLSSHTHWQVAQGLPANQNLPKSMPAHTRGLKKRIVILETKKKITGKLVTGCNTPCGRDLSVKGGRL